MNKLKKLQIIGVIILSFIIIYYYSFNPLNENNIEKIFIKNIEKYENI
jgi:hypothetical protein